LTDRAQNGNKINMQGRSDDSGAKRKSVARASLGSPLSQAIRIACNVAGNQGIAAERLGYRNSTQVCMWISGARPIQSQYVGALIEILREFSGQLPGHIAVLREAERQAKLRESRIRAERLIRLGSRAPARRNGPALTAEERRSRRKRDKLISRRIRAGEEASALADEYGVTVRTIERWAVRGGGLV
jgi:DNA-binding transcriptional regulator YdaS (Cro superfamily)